MEHHVSSSLLRNLEPNEYVRHLAHSNRVHDPCFNWMKGPKCHFQFPGTQHCNVQTHNEILVVLCTYANCHERSWVTSLLETVQPFLANLWNLQCLSVSLFVFTSSQPVFPPIYMQNSLYFLHCVIIGRMLGPCNIGIFNFKRWNLFSCFLVCSDDSKLHPL